MLIPPRRIRRSADHRHEKIDIGHRCGTAWQEHAQSRLAAPGTVMTNGQLPFGFDLTPLDATATPEPGSLVLLGTGVLSALGLRKRKPAR
jgi:hypothetical protein